MKKTLITLFFALLTVTIFAQGKQITAKFKNEKTSFQQTTDGSVTKFDLVATEQQISNLKAQASSIPDKMQISITKNTDKTYSCVLTVTHQNHPEYVHKMFVYLGIESFIIDGKEKKLDELVNTLKTLK